MENEARGTPGQHTYTDAGNVVSSDKYGVEEHTGEEFSREFLRDRYTVRRVPEEDQIHASRLGFNGYLNHQLGYQDLSSIIERRRNDSCTFASDFSPGVGYAVEAKNKAYHDKIDYNRTPKGPNSPSYFMMDSPRSYYPFDAGVSEPSYSGKMKCLCSFRGKILPRSNDGKLRYIGGETRIISIRKNVTWDELAKKTSAICKQPHIIKYQLPGEDLDALISVCSNEDLHHLIEEYHDLERIGGSQRLRLFLEPSDELENPDSSEAKSNKQEDAEHQYVTANGIIDLSPHMSSSGQSLTSGTTQMRNNSACSPSFARGSPTSSHAFENSAYKSPYHTAQLLPTHRISKESLPISLVTSQYKDPMITKLHLHLDPQCYDGKESTNPFVTEKLPRDNSYYVESSSYHINPYHRHLESTNYLHNEYFSENDHINKPLVVNFNNHNPDLMPSQSCAKDDMKSDYTIHNENAFQSCNLVSHCEDPVGFLSASNDKADSHQKMVHALSDSQLHEHDEKFVTCLDGAPGGEVAFSEHKINNVTVDREKCEESFCVRSQPSVHCHDNGGLQSVVIFEDVNHCASPEVFYSSRARVQYESTDELSTSKETVVNVDPESDFNDAEVDNKNTDGSISDAALAELEASIYGLQIIKNADLEELQELGSGTFGTVYHGKWRGTDVAIKRIKKSCFAGRSSEQERLTKDFWREAQILSNLHHPNVLAFYGVVPDGPGGTLATVTEFMVNGSLRHVLQTKDRSIDRRKRLMIALDAAFGMEYLHMKNIVHFDLKCDNLLVNLRDRERPVCKVGDFGLSRIKCNTLVSGGVRGTLPWMAPELLNGSSNKVSEKIDVYSFGMAMWEIVTREEPYANMHCGAIIGGIVNNMLRPPIPENCDPEWRKLMEECWSQDPLVRPSFTEITNRLRVMSMALQTNRRTRPNR